MSVAESPFEKKYLTYDDLGTLLEEAELYKGVLLYAFLTALNPVEKIACLEICDDLIVRLREVIDYIENCH